MKMLRYIVIGMILALVAGYLWALAPVSQSNASEQTWASTDSKGQITVSTDSDSYNQSTGTYTARFRIANPTKSAIDVTVKWLTNFCTGGHINSCLDNQNVVTQGPFHLAANGGSADPSISTSTHVNFTPANIACGTFQDDFFFTTSTGATYGTTNLQTTLAAGWFDTNVTCQPKVNPTATPVPPTMTPVPTIPNPTITPIPTCTPRPACLDADPACELPVPAGGWCPANTPTPTMTPVPTIPNPTLTPVPTETTQNCGDNNTTNQTGTNNNDNNNCNNNQNNNNNSSNSNSDSSSSSSSSSDQNNNQSINNSNTNNITITSYAPAQQQQQQVEVAPAPAATSLPSTGPTDTLFFMGMPFLGYFIKRFTRLG